MENNGKYMELALEIGFSRMGKTSPNPPVGAVIVKNGMVISSGGTNPCGLDHAELCAIKNAGHNSNDLQGAELYVSLEPCCHYEKKTPPCTDAIKTSGISRVYIPILDPNPAVAGRGVETLRAAGIDVVILSEFSEKAYDLIRPFTKYIIKKTPFIIHKSAITLDGRIASKSGDSKWISSEYSRYVSHRLRSIADAVIIGKNTLMTDNPSLNIRLDSFSHEVRNYFERKVNIAGRESFFIKMLLKQDWDDVHDSPLRVLMGLPGRIDFTKNFFKDDNFVIFARESSNYGLNISNEKIQKLHELNQIIFIKGNSVTEQIRFVLNELYKRGKMMLVIEGGGGVAGSFLEAGEIDQFIYFIAPKILGSGIEAIKSDTKKTIAESHNIHNISIAVLKDDIMYNAYSEPIFGLCEEEICLQD